MHLDEAFQTIGIGIMQRCAVIFLSLAAFAEGFITAGAFFLNPHVSCDFSVPWNDTSLYSLFLFGMFIGTFSLGATSDISGRQYTLKLSIGVSFVSCIAISAGPSLFNYELALLILGFGIAGVHVACRVFLFELIPMNNRGSYTITMDLFSNIGILSALVWGRYLLSSERYLWSLPSYPHWRLFYYAAALLCLTGCFFTRLTFYSPRQMLAHQRVVGTIVLMKRIFALNQCKHETSFPVTYIEPFTKVETRVYHRGQLSSYLVFSFRCVGSYIVDIFLCPHTVSTILLIILNFTIFDSIVLANGLASQRVLYGLDKNLTVGQAINETLSKELCNFGEPSLYIMNIYLALVAIWAVCLVIVFIDLCPRNVIILISTAVCGTCCMVLSYEHNIVLDFVSAITFVFSHTVLVVTLNVIILETYPTKYRGTAYGLCKMIARITSFSVVQTADLPALHIFGMIAYLMFVSAVFSVMLRNKNREPIDE